MILALWTIRALDFMAELCAFVAELGRWALWFARGAR
jgi:hypothetical protein